MLGVMLGGTVPFLSFFVERKVRERVAGQSTPGQSTAEA
jgi:hypothetical protein